MVVAACYCELFLPGSGSLKDKRQVLKSLCQKLRRDLGLAVAEVDFQDLWQRGGIGLAAVSSDKGQAEKVVRQALKMMDRDCRFDLIRYHISFY
ncbi:MAG: DUF503 domain-containing protein [Bacillota bacterium]